jgi:hypothetical protein
MIHNPDMREWGVLAILLAATFAYSVIASKSYPRARPVVRRNVRLSTPALPPIAPMVWDDYEGAYMASLVVGTGVVELVLDTGSSQLSVKGPNCTWRQCGAAGCSVSACPCGFLEGGQSRTDCSQHYYQPAGTKISPGQAGSGVSTVMTYGSQTDTIEHYLDLVSVPTSPEGVTCADLRAAPRAAEFEAATRAGSAEVIVHRVLEIEGSSSSNLLGLSRPNKGSVEHGSTVLLDALVPAGVWSVVFHASGGWLALGALPCFSPVHHIPLVSPRSFDGFLTSFYIVEIVSISVGGSEASLRPLKSPPRYCVVDTGTTSTYGSVSLGKSLDAAGYDEASSVLRLELGSAANPVSLTYTAAQLRDPDSPRHSVIQAWPGRTLPDYDDIFAPSHGGVILLGALMMNNMYWEFDVPHKTIGVSDLR